MFKSGNSSKETSKSGAERRTSPRLPPTAFTEPISVRFNSAAEVSLVNISRGGAMLQSAEMLRPNTKIALQILIGGEVHKIIGRVIRSQVAGLEGGLHYHSAISFDRDLTRLDEMAPARAVKAPTDNVEPPPSAPEEILLFSEIIQTPPEEAPEYTPDDILVITPELVMSDPAMLQALKLNRW